MSEHAWAEKPRERFTDLASELAAGGQLSQNGDSGMLTAGTVILEFIGLDGRQWHTIIALPRENYRDGVVHLELLRRAIQDVSPAEDDDS